MVDPKAATRPASSLGNLWAVTPLENPPSSTGHLRKTGPLGSPLCSVQAIMLQKTSSQKLCVTPGAEEICEPSIPSGREC